MTEMSISGDATLAPHDRDAGAGRQLPRGFGLMDLVEAVDGDASPCTMQDLLAQSGARNCRAIYKTLDDGREIPCVVDDGSLGVHFAWLATDSDGTPVAFIDEPELLPGAPGCWVPADRESFALTGDHYAVRGDWRMSLRYVVSSR